MEEETSTEQVIHSSFCLNLYTILPSINFLCEQSLHVAELSVHLALLKQILIGEFMLLRSRVPSVN